MLQTVSQHGAQKIQQQGLKTSLRVALPCQLGQGQSALGQGFKNQHSGLGLADQLLHDGARSVGAVARKSGGAANQQRGLGCCLGHDEVSCDPL